MLPLLDDSLLHLEGRRGKALPYYFCLKAQKHACPSKSVPAGQIESFVVEQIKRVGKDPGLLEGTLRHMREQHQ